MLQTCASKQWKTTYPPSHAYHKLRTKSELRRPALVTVHATSWVAVRLVLVRISQERKVVKKTEASENRDNYSLLLVPICQTTDLKEVVQLIRVPESSDKPVGVFKKTNSALQFLVVGCACPYSANNKKSRSVFPHLAPLLNNYCIAGNFRREFNFGAFVNAFSRLNFSQNHKCWSRNIHERENKR